MRRIKHALPPARWPTPDEAARSLLYSPLRLGTRVVAEQRTWVPAMVPWRATEDGLVTRLKVCLDRAAALQEMPAASS